MPAFAGAATRGRDPSRIELIAIIGVMSASVAFGIDSLLPAMPQIDIEFGVDDGNNAFLVLTTFFIGLSIGTFVAGPLSDVAGRLPVVYAGFALYALGAAIAWIAPSFEMMLAGRLVQGLGASAPRICALAIIRDRFSGREMAQIISYSLIVFTVFPAVAPAIGAGIMQLAGWRAIYAVYAVFAGLVSLWVFLRLPETLHPDDRRQGSAGAMLRDAAFAMSFRVVIIAILVQSLTFGCLLATLNLVQPMFDGIYDRSTTFPFWFAALALLGGLSAFVNATIVMRIGMRATIASAGAFQMLAAGAVLLTHSSGLSLPFWAYFTWITSIFFLAGLAIGNVNAMAMEPLGEVAGTVASLLSGLAIMIAAVLAMIPGLTYDGTPMPLAASVAVMCTGIVGLMLWLLRAERVGNTRKVA